MCHQMMLRFKESAVNEGLDPDCSRQQRAGAVKHQRHAGRIYLTTRCHMVRALGRRDFKEY